MSFLLSGYAAGPTISAASPMTALGVPTRPSYAIISNNTSNTGYEAVFLDGEFRKITYASQTGTGGYVGALDYYDNSRVGTGQMNTNQWNTATAPGSSESTYSPAATVASSEFGNDGGSYVSERGLMSSHYNRFGTNLASSHRSSFAFVNSDHTDRTRVLLLDAGYLVSAPLWLPASYNQLNLFPRSDRQQRQITAAQLTAGSQIANMIGSASYNLARKELVVMAYNTTVAGQYDVHLWKNVDFDTLRVDVTQLATTPSNSFSVNLSATGVAAHVSQLTNESKFRLSPVLCDDGSIFFTLMYPSTALRAFKIARAAGDASGTLTFLAEQALTTSYGLETNERAGRKSMQSRNGASVLQFCPYYYYGSGIASYVFDKRYSTWAAAMYTTNNSFGIQPVKYRDDGFAYYYAGNYYASNAQGAYIQGITQRALTTGAPITTAQTIYLPVAPQPNTTNYPGISHVWEYNLQSNLPV